MESANSLETNCVLPRKANFSQKGPNFDWKSLSFETAQRRKRTTGQNNCRKSIYGLWYGLKSYICEIILNITYLVSVWISINYNYSYLLHIPCPELFIFCFNSLESSVPMDRRSFRTGPKKILEVRSVQDLKIAKRTSKDLFFDPGTIIRVFKMVSLEF